MNIYNAIIVGEVVIGLLIWISMSIRHRIAMKTLDVSLLDIQLKTPISGATLEILDQFITECFNEYLILNVGFLNEKFISNDTENDMVKALNEIVTDRLSATMFKQLSVYYNEKAIPIIIANKIYMAVMNYTIEHNRAKESTTKNDNGQD